MVLRSLRGSVVCPGGVGGVVGGEREMAVFISQGLGPTTLLTYFPRSSTMPSFPALEKEGSGP